MILYTIFFSKIPWKNCSWIIRKKKSCLAIKKRQQSRIHNTYTTKTQLQNAICQVQRAPFNTASSTHSLEQYRFSSSHSSYHNNEYGNSLPFKYHPIILSWERVHACSHHLVRCEMSSPFFSRFVKVLLFLFFAQNHISRPSHFEEVLHTHITWHQHFSLQPFSTSLRKMSKRVHSVHTRVGDR